MKNSKTSVGKRKFYVSPSYEEIGKRLDEVETGSVDLVDLNDFLTKFNRRLGTNAQEIIRF